MICDACLVIPTTITCVFPSRLSSGGDVMLFFDLEGSLGVESIGNGYKYVRVEF